jgi:hypothetical protein
MISYKAIRDAGALVYYHVKWSRDSRIMYFLSDTKLQIERLFYLFISHKLNTLKESSTTNIAYVQVST